MSRHAVVTVPAGSVAGLVGTAPALIASFALADAPEPDAPHAEPLAVAFRAACAHAGRAPRGAVRVRATSRIPAGRADGAAAAVAAVAGAAAADALLGLALTDADLARLGESLGGAPAHVAAVVRTHRVAVRWACDDAPDPTPSTQADA